MAGPLSGYRILEIAGIGPGPFAAMLLADMGAEVIRVDRAQAVRGPAPDKPAGDLIRKVLHELEFSRPHDAHSMRPGAAVELPHGASRRGFMPFLTNELRTMVIFVPDGACRNIPEKSETFRFRRLIRTLPAYHLRLVDLHGGPSASNVRRRNIRSRRSSVRTVSTPFGGRPAPTRGRSSVVTVGRCTAAPLLPPRPRAMTITIAL